MKGKDLQEAVRKSKVPIAELERKTGIKARTIYSLYEKEEVEQGYLEKLEAAGVKLHFATPGISDVEHLTIRVKDLEALTETQRKYIASLEAIIERKPLVVYHDGQHKSVKKVPM